MTAKDLLYKILDYNYLWNRPDRINSKPSKVRLSQIEILLEAFGLTKKYVNPLIQIKYSIVGNKEKVDRIKHLNQLTNLEYLMQGEFLFDRETDLNKELEERAMTKVKDIFSDLPEDFFKKRVDIGWMFNDLLRFRQEIYNLTYPTGGMLEGFSIGLHYSQYLQKELKDIIKSNLSDIDDTLCLILDPKKRVFKNEEIDYAEVDLKSIDLEWRMENY